MSPTGAEVIRQITQPDRGGRPLRGQSDATNGNGHRADRRARERASGTPGTSPAPSTSRAAISSRASRASAADRDAARRHLLRLRPALRAGREHAAGAARLRERRVDDRRHHAVEGPRLRRRGPAVADQGAARALLAPPARAGDRARGADQAAERQGAAARRRRARLADRALPGRGRRRARSASSTTTRSTSPTSSARSSTRPTGSACRRSTPPRSRSTASTRT